MAKRPTVKVDAEEFEKLENLAEEVGQLLRHTQAMLNVPYWKFDKLRLASVDLKKVEAVVRPPPLWMQEDFIFEVDGKRTTIEELMDANMDDPEALEVHRLLKTKVGEVVILGGGAFAEVQLKRVE